MEYLMVLTIKNRDGSIVDLFAESTDESAKEIMEATIRRIEATDKVVIGKELYAIHHSVC